MRLFAPSSVTGTGLQHRAGPELQSMQDAAILGGGGGEMAFEVTQHWFFVFAGSEQFPCRQSVSSSSGVKRAEAN